jgi:stage V sporulation protein G
MEITDVRVFPVGEEKLKAFVSIIIDDCFVVSDIKVILGTSGLFVSMPSKKRKNGTFRDIAHPLNNETRRKIEESIIAKYKEVLSQSGAGASGELRQLQPLLDAEAGLSEEYGHPHEDADPSDRRWPG